MKVTRRSFISKSVGVGLGTSFIAGLGLSNVSFHSRLKPYISKTGEKHLFVDSDMLGQIHKVYRKVHAASKLAKPVLEADMPWEQGDIYDGKRDRRVYIYGTVLKDESTGLYKMWYNRLRSNLYATSTDGINWTRPNLGQLGDNNMFNLFDFHCPSFILDRFESDPAKRYKAVGSSKGLGYFAAYSADGLNWNLYPKNPILKSSDTITLSQDPVTGEYLAFHKVNNDPRVKGRQVFLSVSKDMQTWSDPVPVMVTDELDHVEARRLPGGTHSEFYNMSAFPYANQWLGMVTHFRRTGEPKEKKFDGGHRQSFADGPIDIQLVHSRDGRHWKRCSDRSPVIALGPYRYDSGSILGLCNSPVISGDEMWMYYTAMTTTHGGYLPDKEMSIARASWRIDGLVSMRADNEPGMIETHPMVFEGNTLFINANVASGRLTVELLDAEGREISGYGKSIISKKDGVNIPVAWNGSRSLPAGTPIRFRFHLQKGDLFSYTVS